VRICVFVLVIRQENSIFSAPYYVICGFSGSTILFAARFRRRGGGGILNINCCLKHLNLRRIQRYIIIIVQTSSRKVSFIVRFEWNSNFSRQILNTPIPNFMKIRPVGAQLLHADRQTDMTMLIVAFQNSANAPEKKETRQNPRFFKFSQWCFKGKTRKWYEKNHYCSAVWPTGTLWRSKLPSFSER